MKSRPKRIFLLLFIAAFVTLFLALDLDQYLTLESFKSRQQLFEGYYENHRFFTLFVYMAAYIMVAALSLPGATVMTLAGGALFGLLPAFVVVSFASTIGATLAFLVARFLLKDYVQTRFGDRLAAINAGIEKEGNFYLFTLRLVPVFPFFLINLAMGLTPIRTVHFYIVSQLGMIPGTLVFVNAGTQLGKIQSAAGILSPSLIFSFALLGVFPIIAKKSVEAVKARKILSNFKRPASFDYNIAVIGAGSAGLVTAYIAAAVKAKVALIEKNRMGGDCLNTGCVPSKALIRSARILSHVARAREFGFKSGHIDYDFAEVMERVQRIIQKIEPHDSVERYTGLGVTCIEGEAKVTSPWTIAVNGKTLTCRSIVIASGARPFVPPIPGLAAAGYLTSDTVWELRKRPDRLIVLGGGPIGCELAQAFCRLGSKVTQVEMAPRIMIREDVEISSMMTQRFESEGICVLTGHTASEVITSGGKKTLLCLFQEKTVEIPFDEILVAVGRTANTSGFGLEELGVALSGNGTVETDSLLATNFPNIYCAGDVAGPYQFTHTAAHQAWYAAVNALFGSLKKFRVDYRVIPWTTFTDPEVARVGLNEAEAKERGIGHEVTRYNLDDLDRAITDSEELGLVKVLTRPGSDKILGVSIVGPHAGDILSEYVLAMKHGIGLNKILGTIHTYPTLAEANKYAAGVWKKAHAPERLLRLTEKFHSWMRNQ